MSTATSNGFGPRSRRHKPPRLPFLRVVILSAAKDLSSVSARPKVSVRM
jgi:hypothetical protein